MSSKLTPMNHRDQKVGHKGGRGGGSKITGLGERPVVSTGGAVPGGAEAWPGGCSNAAGPDEPCRHREHGATTNRDLTVAYVLGRSGDLITFWIAELDRRAGLGTLRRPLPHDAGGPPRHRGVDVWFKPRKGTRDLAIFREFSRRARALGGAGPGLHRHAPPQSRPRSGVGTASILAMMRHVRYGTRVMAQEPLGGAASGGSDQRAAVRGPVEDVDVRGGPRGSGRRPRSLPGDRDGAPRGRDSGRGPTGDFLDRRGGRFLELGTAAARRWARTAAPVSWRFSPLVRGHGRQKADRAVPGQWAGEPGSRATGIANTYGGA